MLSGHSAAREEIKHYESLPVFYWISNRQFWQKSHPVPGVPKKSCSALQNFSWRLWLDITCFFFRIRAQMNALVLHTSAFIRVLFCFNNCILCLDSRLFLDISRSIKYPNCSPMICLICSYLRLVSCSLYCENIF